MQNKTKIYRIAAAGTAVFALLGALSGCRGQEIPVGDDPTRVPTSVPTVTEAPDVTRAEVEETVSEYVFVSAEGDGYTYVSAETGESAVVHVVCEEGTPGAYTVEGNTIRFRGFDADSVYTLSGAFYGNVTVEGNPDCKLELSFAGMALTATDAAPLTASGCGKLILSAKKDTVNSVYDLRPAVTDDTAVSAAIWTDSDLQLSGKGSLFVVSSHNNGVHTKDNLTVKNLTLQVECRDNALKGNDGVTVESGELTLIAATGDGIKTTATDVSAKGNQRGGVTLSGGSVLIYAACDGIDAAYDVEIGGEAAVSVFTHTYSPYSETVTKTDTDAPENARYIRFTSKNYHYSVQYYNSDTDFVWENATYYKTVSGGMTSYYYYAFEKREDYRQVRFYIYSEGQTPGQDTDYLVCSDYMNWNDSYDTFALSQRGSSLSYNWTNYTATVSDGGWGGMGGGPGGGPGGMADGNSEKGAYSTKGVKAGNEIRVTGGQLNVTSYDDALHAGSETALENGASPTGNVVISGGTLTLFSKDDGIHADGELTVSGGKIDVTGSYEGLEGMTIQIGGGDVSVVSSDDGFNSVATAGTGITFTGGKTYIYAGGDGVDANSRTSYEAIHFEGGEVIIVSTTSMNSSIDTEQGYAYTGGTVLALCPSNGMGSEAVKCRNFSSVGKKTTMSLKSGQTLEVKVDGKVTVSVTMPCQLSALVVYLGANDAEFQTKS